MRNTMVYRDEETEAALDACASEPVHIPGTIQPIGHLIGCDPIDGNIRYASENCSALFGQPLENLFDHTARDLLGPEIWHQAQNFKSHANFANKRHFLGLAHVGDRLLPVHMSKSGAALILEIENKSELPEGSADSFQENSFLIDQIQACDDEKSLFDLTTRLLRHLTGFDRVMIYKFDSNWNGEVLAEASKASLESFLGLRFPSWDIPAQARDIMMKIKLRLISDVDAKPVQVLAANCNLPPLDMTQAQLRGVSGIHMEYLRNMGSAATMTLSIVVDGKLWGIISFHHTRPRLLASEIRQILVTNFLPIFCLKLNLIRAQQELAFSQRLDAIQADIQARLEERGDIKEILGQVGEEICNTLHLSGLAVLSGSQSYTFGDTAPSFIFDLLLKRVNEIDEKVLAIESLAEFFPDHASHFGKLGGALVIGHKNNRGLVLLREQIAQSISWAGNPEKTIENTNGTARLTPRASFSAYLEQIQGRSMAWSDSDLHLAEQLWPLLSAAERQAFMNDLSRQQTLMIGELNHRVRNILSLVKSVSQQARRTGGSLETYSQALEARIHALAAAHDIGSRSARTSVSIHQIIRIEAKPFDDETPSRVKTTGPEFAIRAESAPIFALVIHELMTNAAKYGALSVPEGKVEIEINESPDKIDIAWRESIGPPLSPPQSKGFGTTLILEAIPYELNGHSSIEFHPTGVEAQISLPRHLVEAAVFKQSNHVTPGDARLKTSSQRIKNDLILIVEDDFMIARDLGAELNFLGFPNTEILSNSADALEFIAKGAPAIALLDINLGSGKTSEAIATELLRLDVPVLFISGYGDQAILPPHLSQIPILTKPITPADLTRGLSMLAGS